MPEKAWDNFFYNQDNERIIKIASENEGQYSQILEISCDESVEELNNFIKDLEDEKEQDIIEIDDKDFVDLQSLLTEKNYLRATLHLQWTADGKKYPVSTLIAYSQGVWVKDLKIPEVNTVNFVPASTRFSSSTLAREYDKADMNNKSEEVLKAIKVIDSSIEQIKTFSIGESAVYLKRYNQNIMPISLFGEATNKVADFILRLINDRNSVLLIDEIENGIHHTSHRELWRMLFRLSEEFGVQIFATTHSHELLEAYVDVALEGNNEALGTYIELTKNIKTDQITGIKHKLETLKYELEHKMGIRGE
jgi:AAA15 family ATPase/GTPase